MSKEQKKESEEVIINQENYQSLLDELKSIIEKGKYNVNKVVDNVLVETRWQIGERIVREELKYQDRADYGKYLLNNLAIDLNTARPRLSEIIRFYKCYPIVRTLREQLSWKHYVLLITIVNQKERRFYENKIIANSWSVRELAKQIKSHLYQETDQNIDLVLYHRGIPCIVLVDLKANKLDSRDIGQMNKYIGYALNGLEEKIFISIYKTKLPSAEKIRGVIREL